MHKLHQRTGGARKGCSFTVSGLEEQEKILYTGVDEGKIIKIGAKKNRTYSLANKK